MYLYCHTNDQEYHDLRNLRFAPEYDPTLATLPICQLSADIVTDDTVWDSNDVLVSLYDDIANTFAHEYVVTEHYRVNAHVVSIVAKHKLYYLENRTLEPVGYVYADNMTFHALINNDLTTLTGEGEIGYEMTAQIDYGRQDLDDSIMYGGYAPRQSARDRLQWVCQAAGLYVKQWGAGVNADIHILSSKDADRYGITYTLIPFDKTFTNPKIEKIHNNRYYNFVEYASFRNTDPGSTTDYYNRYTIVEPQKTQDGLEIDGEYIWAHPIEHNKDSQNDGNGRVVNDRNTLIAMDRNGNYSFMIDRQSNLGSAYCRRYEVTLDVINNGEYWPGDAIKFYVDETTVYSGVIKSCDFIFGKQTRSRLVISTDLIPMSVGHLIVHYIYNENGTHRALGKKEFYVPLNTSIRFDCPVINVWVVDHSELFVPRNYPDPQYVLITIAEKKTYSVTQYYKRVRDP